VIDILKMHFLDLFTLLPSSGEGASLLPELSPEKNYENL